jgi:hypothetical protein
MAATDVSASENQYHECGTDRQWTQQHMSLRGDATDHEDQKERSNEFNDTFS